MLAAPRTAGRLPDPGCDPRMEPLCGWLWPRWLGYRLPDAGGRIWPLVYKRGSSFVLISICYGGRS